MLGYDIEALSSELLGDDDIPEPQYDANLIANEKSDSEEEQQEENLIEHVTSGDASIDTQPKLVKKNVTQEKLVSDKGLVHLVEAMGKKKFRGPGHEAEDLRSLMNAYESWAHELMPAQTFKTFLERAQNAGKKNEVKKKLESIRYEIERNQRCTEEDAEFGNFEEYDPNKDGPAMVMETNSGTNARREEEDEFDDADWFNDLPSETLIPSSSNRNNYNNNNNNSNINYNSNNSNNSNNINNINNSDSVDTSLTRPSPFARPSSSSTTTATTSTMGPPELSEEIKRKIEENKRKALERKRQRELNKVNTHQGEIPPIIHL